MNRILIILLLYANALWAQNNSYMQITGSDGLSNNFILAMAFDGDGNLWTGTEAGLNRIAGHTITVYRREQLGTDNDKIMSLIYDRHNDRMLIGTEKSLTIYDCKKGCFDMSINGDQPIGYGLVDMVDDHREGIWLIYGNGRIQHLDCNKNLLTTLPVKLPNSRCGMDDGEGRLYVGHSKEGMSILNPKNPTAVRRYRTKVGGLPSNNVRRIVKDGKGRVWIGTDQGLAQFNLVQESFTLFNNATRTEDNWANVYDIKEMADGHLWIATDVGGVFTDDGRRIETSSMNTRRILQDDYQNIWIGNHSTGVDFIPKRKPLFQALDLQGTNTRRVYGITSDSQGRIWVSGEDHLSVYRYPSDATSKPALEGRWRISGMTHRAHSFARCLMADSQGSVWLGMEDEGIIRFNVQRQQFEPIDIGYGVCDIHSFMEDTDGRIWIGAEYGVSTYYKGHVTHQEAITKLTGRAPVTTFIRLSPNQLLLATQGRGIVLVNTQTMAAQYLTMAEGLPSNNINHAILDQKSGLWLGTNEGLIRLPDMKNLRRYTVYNTKSGLADHQLRAIQQDQQGRIWATTYTGIVCFDTLTERFYNYGQQNNFDASGFMEGSVATLKDGSIAFGSSKGVYYFQPEETETSLQVSPVRIVKCEVFSPTEEESKVTSITSVTSITANGHMALTYQQNTLRIAYTVSDYAQADDVEYSYMMKGLSDKWYPVGNDHEVTFRSLRPGHYMFVLRAKLRNQDWEEAATTQLSIRITPPFWLSWWAWVIYAAMAFAILWFLILQYKRRIALHNSLEMTRRESLQKQALNEERLRFFTNITHELRTPLTLILGPLEDLAADGSLTTGSRRKVELINKSAERLRDLINQILEFRKTETQNRRLTVARDDIGQFVREIVLNYQELNRNQKTIINYMQENNLPKVYFDSEIISTVLNNLLSNAVKYTEQGTIDITVEATEDEKILIHVADTGYGIAPEALPHIFDRYYQAKGSHQASGTGIGLSLVKSLVDLHEGQIMVQSEEGKGSEFTLSLSAVNTYPNALHKEDTETSKENMTNDASTIAEEEASEAQQPLLLIVEDNEDIRQYIADSLCEDFRIIQATNGLEGVALATENLPDLIVSDIMMPKMNGIQMVHQLKDNIQTSHIPIILLTAKDTDEDKEEGYDSGADSYLTKPFTAKLLTSRIRNLLANRRRLAEMLSSNGIESISSSVPSAQNALSHLDREFMERLNSTIEEHIMQTDIDMTFLTDKMAMSHSTFYRKVKALTGLTAKEYVRKQRLRHCYKLLESGDYNVTEAAMMTGFNQMAHFREVFKKEFGILPSELTRGKKIIF